ncbi:hypothetical protein U9M48_005237 [Paspalum notatum var. saurae]|uniref:Uncharacterized protein n=1 Tax=Paspalum notatum var. saurae TaxID=547442 RepID=A0AAQ3PLF9_PASNO
MRFGGSLILGRRSTAAHPRAYHRRAYATQYRRTRSPPVFDIYVEEHAVHRVLRRFGLFREIVVPREPSTSTRARVRDDDMFLRFVHFQYFTRICRRHNPERIATELPVRHPVHKE